MKNGPYELVIAPPGYPGKLYRNRYAYEHHLVWWLEKGQVVPGGYEIHHINREHRDNRIENLVLLTSSAHRAIHSELRRKLPRMRKCTGCEKIKSFKDSRTKYCSRLCYVKYNR